MPSQAATFVRATRLAIVDGPVSGVEPPGAFAQAVRDGLQSTPRTLPCRYFYDDEGSQLFERICDLPEYYLTRTEDAILAQHADAMVAGWVADPILVELGSGSSSKTRRLIEALLRAYDRLHYVPIDVSRSILEDSARALVEQYPHLRVTGYAANYRDALVKIAARFDRPKLFAFLGSSLGNYETEAAVDLLRLVAQGMDSSDRLLLGTDLDKNEAKLKAAYDDAQGVTAQFNVNLLHRINRDLGGDFNADQFRHESRYNPEHHRVEMHLVSQADQTVTIPDAEISVHFARGESIHTENSHKYTPELLAELAHRAGFEEEAAWTDAGGQFRVQRWRLQSSAQS